MVHLAEGLCDATDRSGDFERVADICRRLDGVEAVYDRYAAAPKFLLHPDLKQFGVPTNGSSTPSISMAPVSSSCGPANTIIAHLRRGMQIVLGTKHRYER
jgi:hypothetical protein